MNPNTERQGEARANMAQAVGAWSNILTVANRDAWTAYAQATPTTDRLGNQLILSGQQMFVKCTLPRLIAGLAIVPAGPAVAGLATTPVFDTEPVIQVAGDLEGSVSVAGAGTTGDLLCYMSQATPPSKTVAHAKRAFAVFFSAPVAGVFTVQVSPAEMPYTGLVGQTQRVTFVYCADDGRVSAEAFRDVVITV